MTACRPLLLSLWLCASTTFAAALELEDHANAPPAATLDLEDLGGERTRLDDLAGKVVVVNFWATWCPPCVAEMPSLDRLDAALDDARFAVLAVNTGDEPFDIAMFLRRVPVELPILLDPELRTQAAWNVTMLPTTFIIGPGGRVLHREVGDRAWDDAEVVSLLRRLAEEGR